MTIASSPKRRSARPWPRPATAPVQRAPRAAPPPSPLRGPPGASAPACGSAWGFWRCCSTSPWGIWWGCRCPPSSPASKTPCGSAWCSWCSPWPSQSCSSATSAGASPLCSAVPPPWIPSWPSAPPPPFCMAFLPSSASPRGWPPGIWNWSPSTTWTSTLNPPAPFSPSSVWENTGKPAVKATLPMPCKS